MHKYVYIHIVTDTNGRLWASSFSLRLSFPLSRSVSIYVCLSLSVAMYTNTEVVESPWSQIMGCGHHTHRSWLGFL